MNIFEALRQTRTRPVNILHGTDWWTDCDDVAALRLLLRAHKAGLINLLCVGINSVMPYSAPSVSAFCEAEGLFVPIGTDRAAVREGNRCKYQQVLASYPHSVLSNDACPDAAALYRKTLAELDGKANIIDVGFPTIIMQLLRSQPDDVSPLSGTELVKQKVDHIWLMAGKWDEQNGREYNLSAYPVCAEAGDYICRHAPVPVTFLGFEVGASVITHPLPDENDLLYQAFKAHGSENGRSSWDPMTALLAIINDPAAAGYRTVKGFAHVDPVSGCNTFMPDADGPHAYVVKQWPDSVYEEMIDALLAPRA